MPAWRCPDPVTGRLLLLEALAARDDSERSREAFARDLAAAHRGTAGDQFGWHHDGYLDRLPRSTPGPPAGTSSSPGTGCRVT
jgi:fructosamine-3-kinase